MGSHISFIFRGYNPYIGGLKPSFFMGTWVQNGTYCWKIPLTLHQQFLFRNVFRSLGVKAEVGGHLPRVYWQNHWENPCGIRLIRFRKCDMKGGLHAVFDYVPLALCIKYVWNKDTTIIIITIAIVIVRHHDHHHHHHHHHHERFHYILLPMAPKGL